MDVIKQVELTTYEFFGYLAPGLVSASGVWLCAASVDHRIAAIPPWNSWTTLVVVLFAAYISGHLTQALGNMMASARGVSESSKMKIPPYAIQAARSVLEQLLRNQTLSDDDVQRVCDAYLVQHGRTGLRDLYVYREGFYRGLTAAFPILAVGVLAADLSWPFSGAAFGQGVMLGAVLILLGGTWLSYRRYCRFAAYRRAIGVEGAVALWIAGETKTAPSKEA